jgi:hypothetical protein
MLGSLLRRFAVFVALPVAVVQAQATTEIIRGRVFGRDSIPIADAEVMVTGLATNAMQKTRTDRSGVYTLLFPNPEGDYVVAVRKLGYTSSAFRLTRVGISSLLGRDVYLQSIRMLDTVLVTGDAAGQSGQRRSVGEMSSNEIADAMFLADPANLMALILSLPGVTAVGDSSFSVLGASSSQNLSSLDGAFFRGGALPPDAVSSVRVITSSADPARGGFAGGNTSSALRGGTDIFEMTIRGSTANRTLAWSDPDWPNPVPRTFNQSGSAGGPIKKGKAKFNVSWSFNDRNADWYTLLSPRASLLSQQGIVLDTVNAVTRQLNTLGVPLTVGGIPRTSNNRGISTTEVFDFTPSATSSIRVSHSFNASDGVGSNTGPLLSAFPTRANRNGFQSDFFAVKASGYVHGFLNELTSSVNIYTDHSDPFTNIPSASVRVGTDFSDGRTGFGTLGFGGGSGTYYEYSVYGELIDELSWLPKSGAHKLKVGGRLSFDRSKFYFFPSSSLLGSYTYLSTADLAANRPASYDRLIVPNARNTRGQYSSLWVGEEWTASKAWQFQGGVRLDFSRPLVTPRYNPVADSLFGIRTDKVPNDVGMSPRFGFSWSSKDRRGQGTASGSSSLGGLSASQISMMPQEMVMSMLASQRTNTLPGVGVNGTIGAYRGVTSSFTMGDLIESTGLPGARIALSCVGAAVPIPDWHTMTEGPTQCADGTSGSAFAILSPSVRVYDPGFRAPLSWRGNLGVDGIRVPKKWIVGINSVFAYNVFLQSLLDLNLNRASPFFLASEASRPVYASPASIVPATGTISSSASRRNATFTTVTNTISDLRGYNAQVTTTLVPPRPLWSNRVSLSFSHTLGWGATEARGNPRIGIVGDPFAKEWVRSPVPLHSFRLTSSGRVSWVNFGINTFVQSGVPLTPLVQGDINGDGNANNDRAFIPDPATLGDPALAGQLRDLIAHAPRGARECLTSQLGRMAGANSCSTPWQARMDLTASVTPPASWGYSDRLKITMTTLNASGALVRLFNLESTPLGQSTLSTTPNATLLYVTGFDPATQRFKYGVNQLFGEPTNYGSARRKFAPLQFQLGLEYKFGGPTPNPMARGLGLRERLNEPPLTDEQRIAAVGRLKRDPAAPILRLRDSLALSSTQTARLDSLSHEFNARADTALTPLTRWVLKKGKRVYDQDLNQRLSPAQSALAKLNAEYSKKAQSVLNPAQVTLLNAKTVTATKEK